MDDWGELGEKDGKERRGGEGRPYFEGLRVEAGGNEVVFMQRLEDMHNR